MASGGNFEEDKSGEDKDKPETSIQLDASAPPEEAVKSEENTELEKDKYLVLASLPTVKLDNCLNTLMGEFLQKQVIMQTMHNVVEFMCSQEAIPLLGNMKALFEEKNRVDKPQDDVKDKKALEAKDKPKDEVQDKKEEDKKEKEKEITGHVNYYRRPVQNVPVPSTSRKNEEDLKTNGNYCFTNSIHMANFDPFYSRRSWQYGSVVRYGVDDEDEDDEEEIGEK